MNKKIMQHWPENFAGEVILLCDAQTNIEKQLLADYVKATVVSLPKCQVLDIALRSTSAADTNFQNIERVINDTHPQFFIPLRVVWQIDKLGDIKKGLSLKKIVATAGVSSSKSSLSYLQKRQLKKAGDTAFKIVVGKGALRSELQQANEASSVQRSLAQFISRAALLTLERAERAITGSRYKIPQLIEDEVLSNQRFKDSLLALEESSGTDLKILERRAEKCLKEMAATPSPAGLDLMAELGRFMYTRGFEEPLKHLPEDLERVRKLVKEKPVAFVFTHKSHVDGFLLYTLFYDLNLPPVHAFSGINMGFMGMGFVLRNAGAILIRRTFGDDAVYKLVFKHYIDYLGKKRFPLLWALEGTRSRTGKLMPPRFGLLNYVVEAYLREDDPELVILPVSIVYDQIPEVSDYDALQGGAQKRKESTLWFMQYLKALKKPYGKIHIRFGNGIEIGDYIDKSASPKVIERREMQKLAFDLAVDANNVTPITVNSLICYILLENGHRAISFNQFKRELKTLLAFIDIYKFPMTEGAHNVDDDVLQEALQQLSVTGVLEVSQDGGDSLYRVPIGTARIAAYYRNGLIQFFITSAVGELALLAVKGTGDEAMDEFHSEALRIRDLMKHEFFFEGSEQFIALLERQFDQRIPAWRDTLKQGSDAIRVMLSQLDILIGHGTLRPFLDAYGVFARGLSLVPAGQAVDTDILIKQSLKIGQQGVLQQRIHCEESVSQSYFENAVKIAKGRGLYEQGEEAFKGRLSLLNDLWELMSNSRFLASVADTKRHNDFTAQLFNQLDE